MITRPFHGMFLPRLWKRTALLRRIATFAVLASSYILAGCARLLGARPVSATAPMLTTFHDIPVGDERRGFLLHRPEHAPHGALPVFIVLHGSSANANTGMEESGMNAIADSLGALVIYPNGTGGIPYFRLFWNYLDCCGAAHREPNEAAMVRAIVDTLAQHFALDRTRIGLIGFSDAGTLAYQLACDEPELLTTIGVISGEAPPPNCHPNPPVSTVVFHGTADGNIHYGNTADYVADWARRQACSQTHIDTVRTAAISDYQSCGGGGGTEVKLYSIIGGKHAWPGGKRSWFLAPEPSRDVDASRIFAAFVIDHPRAK
jgi:polyhydroxybutyrate depolymerase